MACPRFLEEILALALYIKEGRFCRFKVRGGGGGSENVKVF